jgi:hypothetical protein
VVEPGGVSTRGYQPRGSFQEEVRPRGRTVEDSVLLILACRRSKTA